MKKMKVEPADGCLFWHRWRFVKCIKGTVYHQCCDCRARIAQQGHEEEGDHVDAMWVLGRDN